MIPINKIWLRWSLLWCQAKIPKNPQTTIFYSCLINPKRWNVCKGSNLILFNSKVEGKTSIKRFRVWLNWLKMKGIESSKTESTEDNHTCKCPRHLSWAWIRDFHGGCGRSSVGAIACSFPILCGKTSSLRV